MPQIISTVKIDDDLIDIVLTDHVLTYLDDPHTPSKTTDMATLQSKAEEAVSRVHDVYRRTRAFFTGAAQSASTGLNLVFSYKKLGVRRFEFKIITIHVSVEFVPRKRTDYLLKVSKKTRRFKGRIAHEIGPNIYALDTSFECADPYGLIQPHLVQEIIATRKDYAPGFCGTLDSRDGSIFYVAQIDDLGNFFVDSALWQYPFEEQILVVK